MSAKRGRNLSWVKGIVVSLLPLPATLCMCLLWHISWAADLIARVMTSWGTGRTVTVQHAASTAMGLETHQTSQSHCGKAFIPSAPLPRARVEQMGLAGWRRPASDHALPVNLRAVSVFLLQASCCPLVLWVPASCVCKVQGCPDAPPHNSWDLCDEPGSSTRCIPVHCLPQLLCWATTDDIFMA